MVGYEIEHLTVVFEFAAEKLAVVNIRGGGLSFNAG